MTARDRLVDSTRALLWERGYVGTSPRSILERSGVGQGSMYHHFAGKAELARAALQRSAAELEAVAEDRLDGPGTAVERVSRWLLRDREVLRGCPVGGLAQDPDVVADPQLRQPVDQALASVQRRLAGVLAEGRARGELDAGLDVDEIAAMIAAVVQGGYVLARAADSPEPFHRAVRGVLALLTRHTT